MHSWTVARILATILAVVLHFSSYDLISATKSHPITTFIDAKWNVTPVAFETAEFLADENPSYYWKFIDEVNNLKPALARLDSDSKQYKAVLKVAKKLLGVSQTELLKLSLALRSLSPRIQAHLQIAREVLENAPKCDAVAFAVVGNKVVCSFEMLESEINRQYEAFQTKTVDKEDVQLHQFNFDQVFPGSESNPVTVVLYNEIGSDPSKKYHELLQEKATKGVVKLINRHFIRTQTNQKVRLSGYGVELHMKSTEYKSQDDSPKQSEDEAPTDAQDNGEMEINGFDFQILR